MATITITLPEGTTLSQGQLLSFTAPCNSEGVTALIINSINYSLLKIDNSFLKEGDFITDALVLVVIDLINHRAYLQLDGPSFIEFNNHINNIEKHKHAVGCTTYGIANAEGINTIAEGEASHAEGYNTRTTGYTAHAEGNTTVASGDNTHAEGKNTTANTLAAHAEGYRTVSCAGAACSTISTDTEANTITIDDTTLLGQVKIDDTLVLMNRTLTGAVTYRFNARVTAVNGNVITYVDATLQ